MSLLSRRAFFAVGGALAGSSLVGCRRRPTDPTAAFEVLVPDLSHAHDPRFAGDLYAHRVARLVHATLVRPDPDTLAPLPSLAEAIHDEPDGAIVVTLRDGALFHDGTPIRAQDVVATLEAFGAAKLGAPFGRVVRTFAEVSALDPRTLRIRPRSPRATLRFDLDFPVLKASEAGAPRDATFTGSGPFAFAKVDDGVWSLVPSPIVGSLPVARQPIVVRRVRDESARALRILAGDGTRGGADVVPNALRPMLAASLCARPDVPPGTTLRTHPGASTTWLVPNFARAPMSDRDVRRAVCLAIDRPALCRELLGDAGTAARGTLPPMIDAAPPPPAAPPFDAELARSLLRRSAAPRAVTLAVSSDRARVLTARLVAQMLGDVGLDVEVRPLELGANLARMAAGDFDLALASSSELNDPDVLRWYLHSTAIPPDGANRGGVRDDAIDRLLDRGLATRAPAERRALYGELEARIAEIDALVPLFHEHHTAVVSGRALGFSPSADGRWNSLAMLG